MQRRMRAGPQLGLPFPPVPVRRSSDEETFMGEAAFIAAGRKLPYAGAGAINMDDSRAAGIAPASLCSRPLAAQV